MFDKNHRKWQRMVSMGKSVSSVEIALNEPSHAKDGKKR